MSYTLTNGHLTVEIAQPGDYNRTRFDWSGFITGVTLEDGKHSFCVPESLNPSQGTGGIGICNEFGIAQAIGYQEAKLGEQFPKLGVGLLTKSSDAKYNFFQDYEVEPYNIQIEQNGPASITFVVEPKDCRGYAAFLTKTISIDGNKLTVAYALHNTGSRAIHSDEYSHNFFGIDGHVINSEYVLRFPFELQPWNDDEKTMADLTFHQQEVRWASQPQRDFYFRLPGFQGSQYEWIWELLHEKSGVGVREISQFDVSSVAVWGQGHVVSPEVFIDIKLEPGEQKSWSRVYEFFAK